MFTLRKITGTERVEMNIFLGESYTLIDRERNKAEFERTYKVFWGDIADDPTVKEELYGFVVHERNGRCGEIIPLYHKHENYIMTCEGKTFANITYK